MKKIVLIGAGLLIFNIVVCGSAGATYYYVCLSGDDFNSGTSPEEAWQTIGKVNGVSFNPGDHIYFKGGETFSGSLYFDSADCGNQTDPVVVGSYDVDWATLSSGNDNGLFAYNCAGFEVKDLNVVGSGRTVNTGTGIFFYNDLAGDVKLDYIRIDNVDASGYRDGGIMIGAWNGNSGFKDVRITNAEVHDNGDLGIASYGFSPPPPGWAHQSMYVGHCEVYNNPGIPGKGQHSGNGIVMGNAQGIIIEFCEAYNNGWLNDYAGGGPVGIWAWDASDVIIQFNESHHNQTNSSKDGGGFDLDGGVVNSVIQYNYSHDNDGAGYLICQYSGARPYSNNTVRYNISENDGRRNSFSPIYFWSSGASGGIDDVEIYNNTVFVSSAPSGAPPAVKIASGSISNTVFYNNIFQTAEGLALMTVDTSADVTFQGNCYWSSGSDFEINWGGAAYSSLTDWRDATGQEWLSGTDVGFEIEPQLADPGGGGTIGDPDLLDTLDAYHLQSTSPLINEGFDLSSLFSIDPGTRDFYGTTIPRGGEYDVGADEYAPTPSPSPSATPTATPSVTPTSTVTPTPSPTPSVTPTQTPTPSATLTPSPSVTPAPTSSVTPTVTPSVTPTPSTTPTPSVTPTATPTPSLTPTPSVTPTPSTTPSPSPVPTATPGSTPCSLVLESGDFNGDGESDIAIFRPSDGLWAVRGLGRAYFGAAGDIPVSGDYNGDGYTDVAIYRPGTGLWAIKDLTRIYYGDSGDEPAPGDYNGDGSCDAAVFNGGSGIWRLRGITSVYFGISGDLPAPGDYDGNGCFDIAVFRPSNGLWAVRSYTRCYYGQSGDVPVPGVYQWYGSDRKEGSFKSQVAIFRPATGLWAIRGYRRIYFGRSGDIPVPGNFTGNSLDDVGIFRDSRGLWAIRNVSRAYFGASGDIPVTR